MFAVAVSWSIIANELSLSQVFIAKSEYKYFLPRKCSWLSFGISICKLFRDSFRYKLEGNKYYE